MKKRTLLSTLLLIACLGAYSEASTKGNQDRSHPTTQQISNDKRGTKNMPLVVEILYTEEDKKKANDDKESRGASLETNKQMAKFTGEVSEYTRVLMWVGILQFVIITIQAILISRQHNAITVIERAYVKMSHTEPGITWFENDGSFELEMKVENSGNTPADVTDVLIRPMVLNDGELLPKDPPYERQRSAKSFHTFLTKTDYIFYRNPELFRIDAENRTAIIAGDKILYIFGYVEYVDKFNRPHRYGYARQYNPRASIQTGENNLVFVSQAGYNYDREIKKG